MHSRNFVVCDSEPEYARHLAERIMERKDMVFQMHTFSDGGNVFQYSKKQKIDILLMEDTYPREMRQKIPCEYRFVLARSKEVELSENETAVWKYQSAEGILAEIVTAMLEDEKTVVPLNISEKDGKIIGVYSPIHRIGKTNYALRMGRKLAKKEKVLYLNLEEYSGGNRRFPESRGQTLADLLYFSGQENPDFGLRLSTMTVQQGELDYIPPMDVTRDLGQTEEWEWRKLLIQILKQSIYTVVILDLSDSVNGLYELLTLCDQVYTPYIKEPEAFAKLQQYEENLRILGYESVLEHTVKVEQRT